MINKLIGALFLLSGMGMAVYVLMLTIRCTPEGFFIAGCMTFSGHPFILTFLIGCVVAIWGVSIFAFLEK